MQVGELCERLKVPYRHVRYLLEQGILPKGVEEKPGQGEHRQLNDAQAFWLGIVLMLKQAGVKTPLGATIANFAEEGMRAVAQQLSWEPGFAPFRGLLVTENEWFIDIGDLKYQRLVTSANPSYQGLHEFDWTEVGKRRALPNVFPVVMIRLDLSRLAELLRR